MCEMGAVSALLMAPGPSRRGREAWQHRTESCARGGYLSVLDKGQGISGRLVRDQGEETSGGCRLAEGV